MRIFKALVKLQEHDILRDLSLNDISQYARLGIVTGNPRVFQGYPDPYPPEPAPVARVGVLAGLGRGF